MLFSMRSARPGKRERFLKYGHLREEEEFQIARETQEFREEKVATKSGPTGEEEVYGQDQEKARRRS